MRARKPYAISVQISLPSRKVVPLRGSIAVGQDATQLSYKTQEPGITRIQASHGELRAGGTSLNVRPRGAARSLTRPQASVATAPPPRLSARRVEAIPASRPAPPPRAAVRSNEPLSARDMTRTPEPSHRRGGPCRSRSRCGRAFAGAAISRGCTPATTSARGFRRETFAARLQPTTRIEGGRAGCRRNHSLSVGRGRAASARCRRAAPRQCW